LSLASRLRGRAGRASARTHARSLDGRPTSLSNPASPECRPSTLPCLNDASHDPIIGIGRQCPIFRRMCGEPQSAEIREQSPATADRTGRAARRDGGRDAARTGPPYPRRARPAPPWTLAIVACITVCRFLRLRGRGCVYAETCVYARGYVYAPAVFTHYRSRKRTYPRIRTRVRVRTRCVNAPSARVYTPTRVYAPGCVYAHAAYTHPPLA